ncbi:hypothetical protein JCM8097_002558 [Rhodosporidiobolus ruineniae]
MTRCAALAHSPAAPPYTQLIRVWPLSLLASLPTSSQDLVVLIHSARDALDSWIREHYIFVGFQIAFLTVLFFIWLQSAFPASPLDPQTNPMDDIKAKASDAAVKVADLAVPKPKPVELDPPKDTPFTKEELARYDGRDAETPIYVAIKKTIYDVSAKRDMYGPGCGYHVFVGKDASRGLGKSSLKPEDAVSDYSTLTDDEMKVLEDWQKYFAKRYNVVGKLTE